MTCMEGAGGASGVRGAGGPGATWATVGALLGLLAACGGSTGAAPKDGGAPLADAGTGPIDAGSSLDGGGSSGGGDASAEAASGCVFPKGTTAPGGTQLVQSTTVTAAGVTSDGYAVYADSAAGTVSAIALTGGKPLAIGMTDGSGVRVVGPAVLVWNGAMQPTGVAFGALTAWTAASGAHTVATASLVSGRRGAPYVDVSGDGRWVLYFDDAVTSDAGAQTADLFVAGVDGSTPVRLQQGVSIAAPCLPQVGFVGGYAVAATCLVDGTGNVGAEMLSTWTGSGGANPWASTMSASIATGARWSADHAGTEVLYPGASGGLFVHTLGSGGATSIDPTGASGLFTPDGASVVYVGGDGSIRRSPVASPSPAVVLPVASYRNLVALSPDGSTMLISKLTQAGGFNYDLFLSSTAPGSTATTLATTLSTDVAGDAFSADGSRALFFANVSNRVGDYTAVDTSASAGKPVVLGNLARVGYATGGAKVVFNDHFSAGATGSAGVADLVSVDTSAATLAPVTLASSADAAFYATVDRKTIVYSWSICAGPQAGLYAIAAP